MKKLAILFALALCVALAGCNQPAPPQGGEPSEPQETPEVDVIITEPEEPTPPTDEQSATLYIGTKAGGFNEHPMTYEGELTAEKLIQSIADLTGWDLTLTEPVISGKGGMSVCLSSESSLFTGEGGDPDALDIWYYMEGDQPLELPILGLSWPIDQPYQWASAGSS